jgi:uncharacterized membrane protein YphA (DoxX/SURF4 family)
LFLVLLRVAIGWHFLTEGMAKVDPQKGKEFSAETYFRVATGPLGPTFRGMIPDVNGLEQLRRDAQGLPVGLKEQWAQELVRYTQGYQFTTEQKAEAERLLADSQTKADNWFRSNENAWRVRRYHNDLRRVLLTERDPNALVSTKERAWKDRQKLNTERKELLAILDGWTKDLKDGWDKLATEDQRARVGTLAKPPSRLEQLNTLTKYGLVVSGACLILGLFTPVAALWAAGFLALIYLSVPPWPGLPASPIAEGSYWIVNKNLIEMLACLVIASTPSGLWIGLDALLFGWIDRRRAAAAAAEAGDDLPDDDSPRGPARKPAPLRSRS